MNYNDTWISRFLGSFKSKFSGFNYHIFPLDTSTHFNDYSRDKDKLAAVLQNPALLKVFVLQCDLFSLGKVQVLDREGIPIEDDPFLDLLKRPNPFQDQSQFLWDHMFWLMLGSAYSYVDSRSVDKKGNKMYYLEPAKMEWPTSISKYRDRIILSDSTLRDVMKMQIKYLYDEGGNLTFPIDRLVISHDLTNGAGNWFKGKSRIDALYKVISNSEAALDAKNINVRYSGKFIVTSKNDLNSVGMTDKEKTDIEDKMQDQKKQVFPVKAMVDIKRFVEDIRKLELGKSYLEDYYIIGSMYNIPKDVLEAFNSSTFENQEQARAAHANYTLEPKGNQWMNSFERYFGYTDRNITISWQDLPFMQVFEKEKQERKKIAVENLNLLLNMGVSLDEANEYLGTNFEQAQAYQGGTRSNQSGQDQEGGGQ